MNKYIYIESECVYVCVCVYVCFCVCFHIERERVALILITLDEPCHLYLVEEYVRGGSHVWCYICAVAWSYGDHTRKRGYNTVKYDFIN